METQETIEAWAAETFGHSDRSALGIATRMNIEVAELVAELSNPDVEHLPGSIAGECADIWIVLSQVAHAKGYVLLFGDVAICPRDSDLQIAAKINVESAELLSALQHNAKLSELYPRFRDIARYTETLCIRQHIPLSDAVNRKMAVNRTRKWVTTESGRMQHA